MRVLFVQRKANKAGAQVCLAKTVKALRELDIYVKVITGEEGWLTSRLKEMEALAGVVTFPSFRAPLSRWLKLGLFSRQVDELWTKHGPFQVIDANDTWDSLLTEWLALKWHIPWVVHLRITSLDQRHYHKYHCHKADTAIAVSPLVYHLAGNWPHQLLEYIPEGLTEEDFFPLSNKECQFPRKIGVIGHKAVIKGWEDLATALNRVRRKGGVLPATVVFWGAVDKACTSRLKEKIPADIEVCFPGHVDNLPEHLRNVDMVIVPSRKESYGMAMVESIAAGVPIMASRTGIVPEIMGENSVWTFSPGDPDSLAEAWLRLPLVWGERLDFLGRWQQKLREEFMVANTTKKLIGVYATILNKK
jgi:glycosyltransferase involved in cell wall biosynthesis